MSFKFSLGFCFVNFYFKGGTLLGLPAWNQPFPGDNHTKSSWIATSLPQESPGNQILTIFFILSHHWSAWPFLHWAFFAFPREELLPDCQQAWYQPFPGDKHQINLFNYLIVSKIIEEPDIDHLLWVNSTLTNIDISLPDSSVLVLPAAFHGLCGFTFSFLLKYQRNL